MFIKNAIRCLPVFICASLFSVHAFADKNNCQGGEYENLQFNALVNNIQLGYTALDNKEVFSCIVSVINLNEASHPEVKILPTLSEPENSIVLCNYYYSIYNVDRPVSVTACKETSSGNVYLRLISFLNID
ncbi:hypothetical protein CA266_23895 (plasmid) [Serratia marcescens]|uniref:hypothetical protein n=1 Tax=Serratia marcescens TaxID=615 RepID=UPI00187F1ECA|nr:hypothetical protein [Serratia marcescens]QOV56307.1 hypothetical protein CA266_23895 [Serratia marcescens]